MTAFKRAAAILTDIIFAVIVFICIRAYYQYGGDGNMRVIGSHCLRYFTNLSNILAGSACFIEAVMLLLRRTSPLPKWVFLLRFAGTVSVLLTFFTCVFFLGPTTGGWLELFTGRVFFLHLFIPLFSTATFLLFSKGGAIGRMESLWGVIPMLLYATVYLVQVWFRKAWPDFYGFTAGGSITALLISYVLMHLAVLLISVLLRLIYLKLNKGSRA